MDGDSLGQLAYLIILLCAVGGWVIVEYRNRFGQALRTSLAWALIFVGVAAAYGLWSDLRSDVQRQAMMVGDQMEVPRSPDGHFYLSLDISGQSVEFMIDTGATNVVLSQTDARRLGIDPASLVYIGEARTANGTVRTSRVKLTDVTLGPWSDPVVSAWVSDGQMDRSLLGMDYLDRFHIEIAGDRLLLRR
jgi:aspartyl protease family protein